MAGTTKEVRMAACTTDYAGRIEEFDGNGV